MFPVRSLALIIATVFATSVPLVGCAQPSDVAHEDTSDTVTDASGTHFRGSQSATIWEDSPLWDCTMMGNQGGVMVKPWFRYDDPTQDDLWANLYPADETGHRPICSDIWGPDTAGYDGSDAGIAQYDYDYGLPIEGYGVDSSKVYDHSKPYGWKAAA